MGQLKIGMELGRFMGVKGGTIRNGREGVKRERWVYYSIIYVMFCCKFMTLGVSMYFCVVGLGCEIGPTYYQVDDGVT